MAAFIFPNNPANEQVVTNTETGTQYIYQTVPGKWVVNAKNPENSFVELAGDTMTGALKIHPSTVTSTGGLNIKTSTNATNNYAFTVNNSSSQTFFYAAGDSSVKLIGKRTQVNPALNFFSPPGIAGFEILGPTVDNPSVLSSVLNCYYNSDSSGTQIRYFGKVVENNDITNKLYVDNQVAGVLSGNVTIPSNLTVQSNLSVQNTLTVSGTSTFASSLILNNATPLKFNYSGSSFIDIKGALLFYGLKADGTRPSWEALKIGIDPNNENFSAMEVGKRFYWTGTYAYCVGSVRNYLNSQTYDFRDTDTANNIVLSITSTEAVYNGITSNAKSLQTKASTEALLTSVAVTPGVKEFQNKANNTGSTLQDFFLVEYLKNSDNVVQLMVSAKDTDNIVVGDVACILPAAFRPASADNSGNGYIPVFTLVNNGTTPTITAQCVIKTDGSIVFINVGGDSHNFYGQCVFTTDNPD